MGNASLRLSSPADPSDPYTACFDYRRLAPPRSVDSIKKHIATIERLDDIRVKSLYLSADDAEPAQDWVRLVGDAIGHGQSMHDPLVLIIER